ncbi:hypothetical protein E1162_06755 [Rhodobacteraceae bacterium RKSG542]|nr:hypothetical protein [Pseudovibrio flavus]
MAKAVLPVATELRLVDLSALARHILGHENANIADLVDSSSEMFFRDGTLKFADDSGIELAWEGEIAASFSLNFTNMGVKVLFDLYLLPRNTAVSIKYVAFDNPSHDAKANTQQLADAVADALIQR